MIAASIIVAVAALLTYGFYRLVRFHNGVGVIGWASWSIPARTSRWVPPGVAYFVNVDAFKLPPPPISPHYDGIAFDAAIDGYTYHYELVAALAGRRSFTVIKNITGPYE